MRKLFLPTVFVILVSSAAAQPHLALNNMVTRQDAISNSPYKPVPGAVLNHTQVMFEYPAVSGAHDYRLYVEKLIPGFKGDQPDTSRKKVIEQGDRTTATLVNGLDFGAVYVWQVAAYDEDGSVISRSPEKRFSIGSSGAVDPARNRVKVNRKSKENKGLVSLDYSHVIIDREGKPVWYLRPVERKINESDLIRDVRITPQGTITLLATQNIYELDVDGNILWTGPNDGTVSGQGREFYHHDFKRLPNGNYMVLGNELLVRTVPGGTDTAQVNFGTIIEYTFWGKPVWVWRSKDYFKDSEIFNSKNAQGKPMASLHLNAFSVDEKGDYVYAGFRDLNRIIKIEKATGKVVGDYGGGLFWHQHDASILPDGKIAVFNNDSISDPKISSSAIVFAPPAKPGEKPRITWKFDCKMDSLSDGKSLKMGSIDLLPNGNYLVNMGAVNRVIEVSKDKKVHWDIFVESWSEQEKKWIESKQYRAHYSSSLYPCYFTVLPEDGRWSEATPQLSFEVTNEGTEPDRYTISYKEKTGKASPVKAANELSLSPGLSGKIVLPLTKMPPTGSVIEVSISSVTNPAFSRRFVLPYGK